MSLEQSVCDAVHHLFEQLREDLTTILGDIPGVHNAVDDAKNAIAQHVPNEPFFEPTPEVQPDENGGPKGPVE